MLASNWSLGHRIWDYFTTMTQKHYCNLQNTSNYGDSQTWWFSLWKTSI